MILKVKIMKEYFALFKSSEIAIILNPWRVGVTMQRIKDIYDNS